MYLPKVHKPNDTRTPHRLSRAGIMIGNFAKTTLRRPPAPPAFTDRFCFCICMWFTCGDIEAGRAFQLIASNFHHLLVSPFFNVLPPPPPPLLLSGLLYIVYVARGASRASAHLAIRFGAAVLINFHLANVPAPNNVYGQKMVLIAQP